MSFSKPRPAYVVPFWEPVIRQQNGISKHGYAARVYFYDQTQTKTLKVEGGIDVYCFEEKPGLFNNKPTKIVTFRPEDTPQFFSESELGPSYTIWVPWDESDSDAPEVSLFIKFRPVEGGEMLMSQQATLNSPCKRLGFDETNTVRYDNTDKNAQLKQVSFLDKTAESRRDNPDFDKNRWDRPLVERLISKEQGPSQMQTTTLTLSPVSRFSQGPVSSVTNDSGPTMDRVKALLDAPRQPAQKANSNQVRPAIYQDMEPGRPFMEGLNTPANPVMSHTIGVGYQQPSAVQQTPQLPAGQAMSNAMIPVNQSFPPQDSIPAPQGQPLSHSGPSIPQVQGAQSAPQAYDPVPYAAHHGVLPSDPRLR